VRATPAGGGAQANHVQGFYHEFSICFCKKLSVANKSKMISADLFSEMATNSKCFLRFKPSVHVPVKIEERDEVFLKKLQFMDRQEGTKLARRTFVPASCNRLHF